MMRMLILTESVMQRFSLPHMMQVGGSTCGFLGFTRTVSSVDDQRNFSGITCASSLVEGKVSSAMFEILLISSFFSPRRFACVTKDLLVNLE